METGAMQDVLQWAYKFHTKLAEMLDAADENTSDQRKSMLMQYLATQERTIAQTFRGYQDDATMAQLKTWSYSYQKVFADCGSEESNQPYSAMDTLSIISTLEDEHNKAIALFENLKSKAMVAAVVDLLNQLIDYEKSEAKRMAQSANRFEDI